MRKLILVAVLTLFALAGSVSAQELEQQQKQSEVPLPAAFEPRITFGIGVGVPFGGIGGNVEAMLNRYFSVSLGMGIAAGNLGWAGGIKAYPIGSDQKVSPRLSAYYGTVAVLDFGDHEEVDEGAAYGVGLSWRNHPKTRVEFDLLYIDYDPPAGFVMEDGSDINLMLGYRWEY
ncbi:hypothetical protein BAC1_00929 [uncultured bacterium]|nr:hypothetical protein BAC1_00929 [uncultured bacterium]